MPFDHVPSFSRSQLKTALRAVREQSEALAAPLTPEDWMLQSMEEASPVKWNLAHTSWFFETFILVPYQENYRRFHPEFGFLFNSYYNQIGDMHPRFARGMLSRPSAREVLEYRAAVTSGLVSLIDSLPEDELAKIAELILIGCMHEGQHQELLLSDIKHALFQNSLLPGAYPEPSSDLSDGVDAPPLLWKNFEGGLVSIGHAGEGAHFDNEGPRHKVFLPAFDLASRLVTNAEYLEFVEAGGYQNPVHWLADGWALACEENWRAPLYWRKEDETWKEYTLFGERDLNPNAPVSHVSFYEAAAYAEWTGFRLPTEFEWEHVARSVPVEGRFLTRQAGPREPAPAWEDEAPAQLYGDLWEWTASPYVAYPGFRAPPGALGEYNGKFMSSQMVLRGGSCATPEGHIRPTYRNFFPPNARWQFSGIRLARDI